LKSLSFRSSEVQNTYASATQFLTVLALQRCAFMVRYWHLL